MKKGDQQWPVSKVHITQLSESQFEVLYYIDYYREKTKTVIEIVESMDEAEKLKAKILTT